MRLRTILLTTLIGLAVWASTPTKVSADTLSLADFGAVGDGVTDDGPALQAALDALADAGGGTLIVPEGRYAIITPVYKDFTALASSVSILGIESSTPVDTTGGGNELSRGLDLVSELAPKTGSEQPAIHISGLQTFVIRDIAFLGTPDVLTDALITLVLYNIEDATIRHCEFYGLSSQLAGGAIVAAIKSGLKIEQSKFLGSTCNSGVYAPVVENLQWRSIAVSDSVFSDYGQRPELYSKTGLSAPYSWINIGNAEAVGSDSPRREVTIRNVFLDEGGFVGISSNPDRYQPATASIDLLYISRLRMNVSNLGTTGHYLDSLQAVFIEKARYEWTHNADSAIHLLNVGNAIIDRAECLADANRIRAEAATGRLSIIDSVYTYLDSEAQTTNVITTEHTEDDPVQYVRLQYETVLQREPDPAGHYYWSDQILRCSDNVQCVADARTSFNSYLASSPSPNFSITGRITDTNGAALSNVTVTLSGSQAVTTRTDSYGRYSFSKLPTSGVYMITPAKRHYTFGTPIWTITTPAGNQTVDFTSTLNRYTLRGRVTDSAGTAIAAVTVTLSGSQNVEETTDANGNYFFSNLPAGGDYTLTPSKYTYILSPLNQTIEDLDADQNVNFTLITYSIGGRVTRTDGTGVTGITLTVSGSENLEVTTHISGDYVIANLPAGGNYTIRPSHPHNTFDVPSHTINGLGTNHTVNFIATRVTYQVSGRITSNGVGLDKVAVTLSGWQLATTTTDMNGQYSFIVSAEGNYTVTPSINHYTFSPGSRSLVDLVGDQSVDFVCTLNSHTLAGQVVNVNNYGIAALTVTLSGSQSGSTITDAGGNFAFANLPAGGTYKVTSALAYHSLSPESKSFSDLSADHHTVFFISQNYHTISGSVAKADGAAMPGVTVSLGGSQNASTITDAGGNFAFANLPAGGTYNVTPVLAYHSLNPESKSFNDLSADHHTIFFISRNYHTISGSVAKADGAVMPGVTVSLGGSQSGSTTTDANGNYSFDNLPAGGDYLVTLSRAHHTFTPSALTINKLDANQIANFTGLLVNYKISGRVSVSGMAMAGIAVTLGGSQSATSITNANGDFSFTVPAEGSYTVTPTKSYYAFSPLSIAISSLGGDLVSNFTATPIPILISKLDSTRAMALDSILHLPEPFQLNYSLPWIADRSTRVMLFATGFDLLPNEGASAITASVEDASHRIYPLTVEYVVKVPGLEWLNQIVVKLNDDLENVGDVLVSITYHGLSSNRVRIGIGHVGGGPPDDHGAVPTPGQPPQ